MFTYRIVVPGTHTSSVKHWFIPVEGEGREHVYAVDQHLGALAVEQTHPVMR